MRCRHCKVDNDDIDRFCTGCGEALGVSCPACGQVSRQNARFCSHCGGAFPAEGRPAGRTTHATEPVGEATEVTILFADFGKSLESNGIDRGDAEPLLPGIRQPLIETVHEYGGTVSMVMGEGLMAVFGAPLAYEDHALRACLAALAMREEIAVHTRSGGSRVAAGVGLCSGEVAIDECVDRSTTLFAATGQPVHVAARMEQMARPGCVMMADDTWQLVEGQVEAVPLGATKIWGLDRPLRTYQLIGRLGGPGGRKPARLQRPFIGRGSELRLLARALDDAAEARGRIAAIVGEPGVGKSRLMEEFINRHAQPDWQVLRAWGSSHVRPAPFSGVIETLSGLFEAGDRDDEKRLERAMVTRLKMADADLEACLPPLGALLSANVDQHWQDQPAEQKRSRIRHAVLKILLAASRAHPLLLAVDDLQWIDADSLDVYGLLSKGLSNARMMLLVANRPGFDHQWHTRPNYMQVPIDSLRRDEADALLHGLLGGDPDLAELHACVLESSGGNAFFIEELVRSIASSGMLYGRPGHYGLKEPVQNVQVPATVQDVIAARIDSLMPGDKRVLLSAASAGNEVQVRLLARLLDLTEAELEPHLDRLQDAELLVKLREGGLGTLVFRHALTHDVAYASIPQSERDDLHGRVVAALEALHSDRLEQNADALAFHSEKASNWGKALHYSQMAGRQALERSACQRAAESFQKALIALRHMPATPENQETALGLLFSLRNALMPLGRHTEILPHLIEAEGLARNLGKERELAQAHSYLAHYHWLVGDWEKSIEAGRLALKSAERADDFGLAVVTRFIIGLASYSTGDFTEAIEQFSCNSKALVGPIAGDRYGMFSLPSVVSRGWLAWSRIELGQFDLALESATESREIAESIGRPFDRVQGLLALGVTVMLRGDLAAGTDMLTKAYDLCQRMEVHILVPRVAAALSYAHARQGNAHAARWLADGALSEIDTMNLAAMRTVCLRWIGEAHLLLGQTNDCLEVAERMLAICRSTRETGHEAWALYLKGAALAESAEADLAVGALDEAAALAESMGMKLVLAHIHSCRGAIAHPDHRDEDSTAAHALAARLYHEMGLPR